MRGRLIGVTQCMASCGPLPRSKCSRSRSSPPRAIVSVLQWPTSIPSVRLASDRVMASYARLLTVAGSRNLRDLGGYRAMDGRRVRRGMLLRSGHPGELTAEGARQFAALGLAAILDLRTTEERAGTPYPPGPPEGMHSRTEKRRGGQTCALPISWRLIG